MKFYGQFDPPLDKVLYERYFKNKKRGLCIEAGSADGENLSTCKFFEESMEWGCINIEPHPESYKKLIINRPSSLNLNLNCALYNRDGEAFLRHGPNFILRAAVVEKEGISGKRKFEYEPVETITFKTLTAKYGITDVDLMVLDVEGRELEAIEGMKGSQCLPLILCVEFNHAGLNKISEALVELGYKHDYTYGINAVFVNEKV